MSYQGVFLIDDEGIRLSVNLGEGTTSRTLIVSFPFDRMQKAVDQRALFHSTIARRVVEATRSLDEED